MSWLILHKVRGEAAFDVAEQLAVDGKLWWIIPTSGHRAYPYKWWPLSELPIRYIDGPLMPHDWPDHYAVNNTQPKPSTPKASSTPTLDDLD